MSLARRSLVFVALLAGALVVVAIAASDAIGPAYTAGGTAREVGLVPTISSVTPDRGSVYGGQVVTIKGSGFARPSRSCSGPYAVWFGTDAAEGFGISSPRYRVISDSEISAVVPANYGGLVNVQVDNRCATSPAQSGATFNYAYPADQCLSGTCSIAIRSSSIGPLTHNADGLLNGFTGLRQEPTPRLRRLLDALALRQWRTAVFDPREPWSDPLAYCDRCRHTAAFSLDLTSDWQNWASVHAAGYRLSPYGDLTLYGRSVAADVANRLRGGQPLSYLDVWNEPATGTINSWLSVYGAAYRAIKAVDSRADLVGPSLDTFLTTSPANPNGDGYKLNITDFLNWEVASGVRFAAVSWHENGAPAGAVPGSGTPGEQVPGGRRDDWSPAVIGQHVIEARELLAHYPSLRGTKVFVNEYGPPWAINIPGWMVGDFAALEQARANAGMMTCAAAVACTRLFDGLLGYDQQPQMPYWVMRAYANMSGDRLESSTPAKNIYALASRPSATRTVEILVGRADDCWGEVACPQFHGSSAGPVRLSISVAIPRPASSVEVSIRSFPNNASNQIGENDVPVDPRPSVRQIPVVRGSATVNIEGVRDGDAFSATVSSGGGR